MLTEQEKEELRRKIEARKQREAAEYENKSNGLLSEMNDLLHPKEEKTDETSGAMNSNQKTCPGCGSVIPANYDVCPVCGKVLREGVQQVSNVFEQGGNRSVQQVQIVNTAKKRYCEHCGAEIGEGAVVCVNCGRKVAPVKKTGGLYTATKVFLVLACIIQGFFIIPLAWCIPITVHIFHSFRDGREVHMAVKIFTLLMVSLVAGILLLCIHDDEE